MKQTCFVARFYKFPTHPKWVFFFLETHPLSKANGMRFKFNSPDNPLENAQTIFQEISCLRGVGGIEAFAEYLAQIQHPQHRAHTAEVLAWVGRTFPKLEPKLAWNQPMFTDHGTFIIGFSVSAKHLAVSPEQAGMKRFTQEITQAGYAQSKMLFRIPWGMEVDYPLLQRIIEYNRTEKADCKTFWRKQA